MDSVIQAIEQIQSIQGSLVDRNYGQGQAVLNAQYNLRTGKEYDTRLVEKHAITLRQELQDIQNWVKPYFLPVDCLFFLEYFGGLLISTPTYSLSTLGVGPMVTEWYNPIRGDTARAEPCEEGMLSIGSLGFDAKPVWKTKSYSFLLDLAGIVKQNCVISLGPWDLSTPDYDEN